MRIMFDNSSEIEEQLLSVLLPLTCIEWHNAGNLRYYYYYLFIYYLKKKKTSFKRNITNLQQQASFLPQPLSLPMTKKKKCIKSYLKVFFFVVVVVTVFRRGI